MNESRTILIRNGRVITGTEKEPLPDTSILIENGRFGIITERDIAAPPGADVIDATGKTILPGLIDMHAHLLSGGFDTITDVIDSYDLPSQERALKQMLYWGVTAVYNPVQPLEPGLQLRARVARDEFPTPRLFISGPGFTAPGGWAGSLLPLARIEPASVEEVPALVSLLADANVDFLKVYYDTQCCAFVDPLPKLAAPIMEKIIEEAHARNLRVMLHAYDTEYHKDALRAGVDILAHSAVTAPVDDEYIELARENGTLYLATLSAYLDAFNQVALREFISQDVVRETIPKETLETLAEGGPLDEFVKIIKQSYIQGQVQTIQENLKKVFEGGIAIGVGPDTGVMGVFPGLAVHREMELMVEAGIPPADVLRAATRTAAEYLGEDELGTIATGKIADLIIVNGNPLDKIDNTRNIEVVIKQGQLINREDLLAEILEEGNRETK